MEVINFSLTAVTYVDDIGRKGICLLYIRSCNRSYCTWSANLLSFMKRGSNRIAAIFITTVRYLSLLGILVTIYLQLTRKKISAAISTARVPMKSLSIENLASDPMKLLRTKLRDLDFLRRRGNRAEQLFHSLEEREDEVEDTNYCHSGSSFCSKRRQILLLRFSLFLFFGRKSESGDTCSNSNSTWTPCREEHGSWESKSTCQQGKGQRQTVVQDSMDFWNKEFIMRGPTWDWLILPPFKPRSCTTCTWARMKINEQTSNYVVTKPRGEFRSLCANC